MAERDHRPQRRRTANRLGERRIAIELRGIVGAANIREGHRIHAQRGADGVNHRQVVNQDAPIGGLTRLAGSAKAIGIGPIALHIGLQTKALDLARGEGVRIGRRSAGGEVGRGLGLRGSELGEVHVVGVVDGVGDLHIGNRREGGGIGLGSGFGGTEVEAHGLGARLDQARGEGDAPNAILQQRRVEAGGGEGAIYIGPAHLTIELQPLGELALFGKELLGGAGGLERLTILPIELADRLGGELDILASPGGDRAGGVVVHAQVIDIDIGIGLGIKPGGDHHQAQCTAHPHELCAIELGHNARHRPRAAGGPQFHRGRHILPVRAKRREGVVNGATRVAELKHHIHRVVLLAAAKLVILRNAILEADRAIARLRIGHIDGLAIARVGDALPSLAAHGGVLARALQQQALAAIVVARGDIQLRALFRADPSAHGRKAVIGHKAIVGVERHAARPIAVEVVAAPGGDIDIIEEDIAPLIGRSEDQGRIRLAHHHGVAGGSDIGRDRLAKEHFVVLRDRLDAELTGQVGRRRPAANLNMGRTAGIGGERPGVRRVTRLIQRHAVRRNGRGRVSVGGGCLARHLAEDWPALGRPQRQHIGRGGRGHAGARKELQLRRGRG